MGRQCDQIATCRFILQAVHHLIWIWSSARSVFKPSVYSTKHACPRAVNVSNTTSERRPNNSKSYRSDTARSVRYSSRGGRHRPMPNRYSTHRHVGFEKDNAKRLAMRCRPSTQSTSLRQQPDLRRIGRACRTPRLWCARLHSHDVKRCTGTRRANRQQRTDRRCALAQTTRSHRPGEAAADPALRVDFWCSSSVHID